MKVASLFSGCGGFDLGLEQVRLHRPSALLWITVMAPAVHECTRHKRVRGLALEAAQPADVSAPGGARSARCGGAYFIHVCRPQAGHEIILQCESDPGAQQAGSFAVRCRSQRLWSLPFVLHVRDGQLHSCWGGGLAHAGRCLLLAVWPPVLPRPPPPPISLPPTNTHLPAPWHRLRLQVLKEAFPGILLAPDVCALQRLPKVQRQGVRGCRLRVWWQGLG